MYVGTRGHGEVEGNRKGGRPKGSKDKWVQFKVSRVRILSAMINIALNCLILYLEPHGQKEWRDAVHSLQHPESTDHPRNCSCSNSAFKFVRASTAADRNCVYNSPAASEALRAAVNHLAQRFNLGETDAQAMLKATLKSSRRYGCRVTTLFTFFCNILFFLLFSVSRKKTAIKMKTKSMKIIDVQLQRPQLHQHQQQLVG